MCIRDSDYPTVVYTKILRDIFPDVPVIAGGIEASMRRLTPVSYTHLTLPTIYSV